MLRADLFGGFALFWGDEPVPPIPGRLPRSLLAFLLTYRDRPHTRDLLAGTFWPELPDAVARRRLSHALWQIRGAFSAALDGLEPGQASSGAGASLPVILGEGDTIRIDPDLPIWIDIEQFSTDIEEAERRGAQDRSDLDRLESSVHLYRGDFLAGYYDDWAVPKRERLRALLVLALTRLVNGYKAHAEYESALVYARRLAAEDPWREEAHREVMRLCHLLERAAEALKQYEICRLALADELGTEPSPETSALAAEIATRAGLPAPALLPMGAHVAAAPPLEQPDQLPLVGRQRELAEMLRLAEAAAAGRGGLAILYGEAGVGKSRLLRELAANAQWRGLTVAWGRCYELAAPPAYQPLVEVLRAGLAGLAGPALEPLWRTELARLLPELLRQTGERYPPPLSPQEEHRRLLEAISRGLLALAATAPHLILLEDLQWIDLSSLEALHYLLPRLVEAPLLVVASVRSEELAGEPARVLAAMESTRLARRLELSRLEVAQSGELVQRCLNLAEPAPRFSSRLHSVTEGNPFFLIETLWALVEEGLLYRNESGIWSTPWDESTADYGELPLPAGVVQSISRRLERLPARLGELLDLAAVIGREVDFRVWLAASGQDEDTLLAAGDELCARKVFLPGEAGATQADYAFSHDQIRRVAYDRLAPPRRRLHHRHVAEALTHFAPGEPEPLAYHWTLAGVWDRAAAYHTQAGDRAGAVHAVSQAVDHYSQALDALARLPGPGDRAQRYDLLLARERQLHRKGDRVAQTQDLAELQALAQETGDARYLAEVALRQAGYANATSDYDGARAAAEQAVDLAAELAERQLEAEARMQWGMALTNQGSYQDARVQFRRALSLGQAAGLRQVQADSLRHAGVVSWYLGDLAEAQSCFEQGLQIVRDIGNRAREAGMINNLGLIAVNRGDYVRARAHFERALRIDREMGDRRAETQTLGNLGSILADLGCLEEAIGHHEQALRICRSIGNRQTEAVQLGNLSLIWHKLGDHEAALDYGQLVLHIAQDTGDRVAEAYAWTYLGHALLGLGQPEEAASAYREALAIRQQLGQTAMVMEVKAGLARVALATGDLPGAQSHVEEVLAHSETGILPGCDELLRISLTCYQVLCAAGDDRADAILHEAHRLLREQAGNIEGDDLRRSFLENPPVNREIVAAFARSRVRSGEPTSLPGAPSPSAQDGPDESAPAGVELHITVSLPRADAPLGRTLRDDEYIGVTWTVAAPEDEAIAGKVARRHSRVLRLLAEAQVQGAAPTHQHLADALGVTRRTIERDVASLRKTRPDLPPTRGATSD